MAERPVAGKGRRPFPLSIVPKIALIFVLLLLAGCASSADRATQRDGAATAGNWISVQRGDTLGGLARRGGVPLERLQRFNPGVDSSKLAVGQRLLMPTQNERAPANGPYRYQIRPGDTFSSIARRFDTRASRVQAANASMSATALKVGQIIAVPLGGSGSTSQASTGGVKASAAKAGDTKASPASASPRKASLPDPGNLPASARQWPWPLQDYRIVRRFGSDSRGTLQPMLLATERGTRAQSVADGEVRFADSMRQLGQVVIVHHADNVQSVYALCEEPLVANGDRVNRGDEVCEVGYSNASERFDLLFDLRHGGKPVDPRRVLR
ncbi:MAG TPA: LysM peptidoglycan-binding domain-containing protein [Halomonas sp.]|nr:LysM peptidoglycan-binding domain-containing protein [Halomonas sp.]